MISLRNAFFFLLLGNVVFFAWVQNGGNAPDGHEPQRLEQQIQADKIKIVKQPSATKEAIAATEAPAKTTPAPVEATPVQADKKPAEPSTVSKGPENKQASPAPAPSKPDETKQSVPNKDNKPLPAPNAPPPVAICTALNGLTLAEAKRLQGEISTRAPSAKTSLQAHKENTTYWIFIPPLGSKAAADKKVAELAQLTVTDAFIMQDEGPNRFAISLGLFRNEDSAKAYLQALIKKGVRSAKMDTRDKGTDKARLEIYTDVPTLNTLTQQVIGLAATPRNECKVP